jgi:hypothetical protein
MTEIDQPVYVRLKLSILNGHIALLEINGFRVDVFAVLEYFLH